ncbi:UDP-N-acetylmuramoyl-L-alanyl-D-glutamate--2,6-diaminopimelate ligase [Faecalispora anaeroviscerum]|uniref:UDP-N-acetylmuramoyl-L-alanyl-D-glutamate--2, 6-diaminopimelate ligase n=1 Tax=Faecalispora anaeroviscerum TaxID=2991836 RepID=UPI0024BB01DF|nr:UDP-N-acetylmuramoyl-L-alanyl-D-glutamate--2,6-diaminopimelate ligase [Faecalispora anaeroviscerum]
MRLIDLLQGMQYSAAGNLQVSVEDLIYDSRKIKSGCAFVCLRGAHADGHQYAEQAANSGACAIIADHALELTAEVPVVVVPDTRLALAVMSAALFGHPAERMKTVGVTGTKGKTTTTYMIRAILEQAGIKAGLIGTIGAVIGDRVIPTDNTTPESYEIQSFLKQMADEGCQCVVMEASSIGLKANRTAGFTFDIGLFTNFSPDHIGGDEHASLEEYMECKSMLFRQCRVGIANMDDENWQGVLKGRTCELETYGFSPEAQLRAENEGLVSRPGYLGARFDLRGLMNFPVSVDIPGKFSAYNALAAIAVCRHFNVTEEQIQRGLSTVKVKGRVEPVTVPGEYTLLIDYAHNAVSMENILETLREYQPQRLVCLFGAGGNRAKSRRYEMGEVCGRLADLSVITADNSRFEDVMDIIADIKIGMAKTDGKYVVIPDRREAIRYCLTNAQKGDVIVLAGKGHEDYQEIRGVKHPFDERVVVAELLKEIEKA